MRQVVYVQQEPRPNSQTIEIPVATNGQGRVPIPDIQQLRATVDRRIVIKAIRLITPEILTNGIITGAVNLPLAEAQKISLVLYCEGWEKGQYIPLLTLNDTATPGGTFPHRYIQSDFDNWEDVDWSKSFLQYSNGTTSANAPYVVMLEVLYVKLDANGNVILGPK